MNVKNYHAIARTFEGGIRGRYLGGLNDEQFEALFHGENALILPAGWTITHFEEGEMPDGQRSKIFGALPYVADAMGFPALIEEGIAELRKLQNVR